MHHKTAAGFSSLGLSVVSIHTVCVVIGCRLSPLPTGDGRDPSTNTDNKGD